MIRTRSFAVILCAALAAVALSRPPVSAEETRGAIVPVPAAVPAQGSAPAAASGAQVQSADGWLRRVWLDLAGAPPPVEVVDAFLARPDAAARGAMVDRLLASPEFAVRWGRLLAAPLKPRIDDEDNAWGGGAARASKDEEPRKRGGAKDAEAPEAADATDAGATLRKLKGIERFVASELRAGRAWWKTLGTLVSPGGMGAQFARPFHDDGTLIAGQIGTGMLGIRLACARCHDDPVHGWSAAEHFGLAAFYGRPRSMHAPSRLVAAFRAGKIRNFFDLIVNLPTMKPRGPDHRWVKAEVARNIALLEQLHRLGVGPNPPPTTGGLDWAAFDVYRIHAQRAARGGGGGGGSTAVPIPGTVEELRMPKLVTLKIKAPHPSKVRAGQTVPPRFPGEDEPAHVGGKRRDALTTWIADPENPFTARALVNRVWKHLMGRGLVEPVDEIEHPIDASGAQALETRAGEFVRAGGSVPAFVRSLVLSEAYARTAAVPSCLSDNGREDVPSLDVSAPFVGIPTTPEPAPPATAPSAATAPATSIAATAPGAATTPATSIAATAPGAATTPATPITATAPGAATTPATPITATAPATAPIASASSHPVTTAVMPLTRGLTAIVTVPAVAPAAPPPLAAASSAPAAPSVTAAVPAPVVASAPAAPPAPAVASAPAAPPAPAAASVAADDATTSEADAELTTEEASVTATAASAPEATLRLAGFRFRDSESACPRERGTSRDAGALMSARGFRPLDSDQVAASLAAATGRTAADLEGSLFQELASALDLWSASARTFAADDAVVQSFPPRMLAASAELQELVRTAPLMDTLAALPDDAARLSQLFRRALARSPSEAEATAARATLDRVRASGGAERGAWSALLFRIVTSAEFLTNH